jgi:hypothetical protein
VWAGLWDGEGGKVRKARRNRGSGERGYEARESGGEKERKRNDEAKLTEVKLTEAKLAEGKRTEGQLIECRGG